MFTRPLNIYGAGEGDFVVSVFHRLHSTKVAHFCAYLSYVEVCYVTSDPLGTAKSVRNGKGNVHVDCRRGSPVERRSLPFVINRRGVRPISTQTPAVQGQEPCRRNRAKSKSRSPTLSARPSFPDALSSAVAHASGDSFRRYIGMEEPRLESLFKLFPSVLEI